MVKTMIQHILPLLKGWRYYSEKRTDPNGVAWVEPSKTFTLGKVEGKSGWVLGCAATISQPTAQFIVELEDPFGRRTVFQFTPSELYNAGFISPNPSGLWCVDYDPQSKKYTVALTPANWMPFQNYVHVYLKAPANDAVQIFGYAYTIVVIDNETDFIESLKEVLGPELVSEVRRMVGGRRR